MKNISASALLFGTSLTVMVSLAGTAQASDKADVMAAVKKWAADYSRNDTKAVTAACSAQAVIIDDFAPYVWQGANACSDWLAADNANNKQIGSTEGKIALGAPTHVSVTGDHAYVVLPVKYSDIENGKKKAQPAMWTLTLQQAGEAWSIAGSAWADR